MHKKLNMKTILEKRNRMKKGISPVISTIIIVAVAIAISIAVASWLMGLWTGFTTSENLKIVTATAYSSNVNGSTAAGLTEKRGNETIANIWIKVKNEGGAAATIDSVYVYNKHASFKVFNETGGEESGNSIPAGALRWIAANYSGTLTPGQTVQIKIITKAGTQLQYTTTVAP